MEGCPLGLEGFRVLVTASTRGIGFATARVLAGCGARVVVNGRSREAVEDAASRIGDRALGVPADLAVEGEAARLVRDAVDMLGGLDALVYVPPPPPGGRFLEVGYREWRLSYRLLVEAPWEAVREAVGPLSDSGRGSIVFVTSLAAWEPIPDIATSSVLRPGLHAMTVLLARELGPRGVRVNSVVPGYIMTDRLRSIISARARSRGVSEEEVLESVEKSIGLGRVGRPEEIGWVVAFLVSPLASYVTGAIIPVTGGRHVSVR